MIFSRTSIRKKTKVEDLYKPTLYILSIGVSKYKNPTYNLGVADADAEAIAMIFKSEEGKIYQKVVSKLLINHQATRDNILDAIDWLDKEATQKDVVVIFIAGHGVNDERGNYYFINTDADVKKLRRTAVKWIDFEDIVKNLPSKVILFADTCHAGNILGGKRRALNADITSALKSIMEAGTGQVIMTATTGNSYSYERKEWGHGAFTKAIIEGLQQAKADFDKDNLLSIKELDLYITNRVKQLTEGKQKPTTIIPVSMPDFPIISK